MSAPAAQPPPGGLTLADVSMTAEEKKVMAAIDKDGSGNVSKEEIMEYVRAKQADKKRLVVALTALVVLLCLSYVAVGGIVFYVIKMTKDTQVAAGSTELTDTSGNTLHVMSTTTTTVASAVSSLDSDNVFQDLQSVSLDLGGTPLTLKMAGFARATPDAVLLFTTSAAIPVLELKGTTLSPGPGASAAVLALFASSATASGGSRLLTSTCSSTTAKTCQQWVSAPTSGYKCPAGTYWNSGATASTSKCFTCNPGKFATCSNGVDGAGSSAACHSSTGCSTIGAGNFATNLIKSPSTGTVWSFTTDAAGNAYAGAQKIAQCGYGTYNAGNNNFCSNCVTVAGKYCNVGASSAAGTACPAGSYCVAGTVKTAPPSCTGGAGRYCPAGSSTANGAACPSGMYCAGGSAAPVAACAASANYFCASAGATPALCSTAEGYYCPAGSASSAGVECPSGKYCAGGATAPVTSCSAAPGYYCATPGATTPTLCPAGSYCTGYTAGPLNCLYLGLAVGRHCPAGTSSTAGEACPVGYFCDGAGGSVACTAATNRYCASGLESLPATSTAGVLCAGTTSATSTTLTTAFTDATGTQSGTFHVCKGGSSAPIPRYCPAGYWHAGGYGFGSVNRWLPATLTADTACVACTSDVTCKTGVYYSATPEQGSAVNPLVLSSGYSTCSNGNTAFGYAGGQFCGPCPAGFYCRTSALGNIVASNILSPGKPLPCSPGTFCPMGNYYGASYTPGPGMYASFCPAGTYAVTVTVAAGEVAGSTHAGDVYACSNCAAGTYSVAGGECLPCAGTAFSTPGSASCSYTSATCPAGTKYNLLTNACEPCPDGYNNSYTGQAACAKAPAGHFAFSSGGTPAALYVPLRGMANAVQCPAGTYTNVAGASKCTPCPADSYAVKGSSMCTICPDGKRVAYGLGTSANSCYY